MQLKRLKFIISLLTFIVYHNLTFGQVTSHPMVHAGYAYQNQSFGEIGGRMLFLENDDILFRAGAAAMFGVVNSEFAVLPKVQGDVLVNFRRGYDIYHSYYYLVGIESTTKYFAPKIGMSLFGIIDLTGGYAIPYGDATVNGKQLKGLNINFTVNVPWVFIHDMFLKKKE